MKVLFIGGTGNISAACSRLLLEKGSDLYLLNRGNRTRSGLENATLIRCDINDPAQVRNLLNNNTFDVVANFIAYKPEEVEQDIGLFGGKCGQYIFISSASAYQKPLTHPVVTESTPLSNPFWDYSRDKIACEEILLKAYRENGFPVTIVRPSHTYETVIPVAIGSWEDFTIIDRMRRGKQVVIHGDGTSLWTITHSEDFARGFTGLIGNIQAIGHAFHITSDEILSWNQIYEAVASAAGAELRAVHVASDFICDVAGQLGQGGIRGNLLGDKATSVIFDNTKIKRFVPGYKAIIPFSQGIKHTVEWFDADASRKKIYEENNLLIDKILESYKLIS